MSFHDPNTSADIDNRFNYHPPSGGRVAVHESIRAACRDLAHQFDRDVPPGREKALAMTQLEQAMFWANAAVARAES